MSTKLVGLAKKFIKPLLILGDIVALIVSMCVSLLLKFGFIGSIPEQIHSNIIYLALIDIASTLLCFFALQIYNRMWQYPAGRDYGDLFLAFLVSKLVSNITYYRLWDRQFFTWYAVYVVFCGIGIILLRLTVRYLYGIWRRKLDKMAGVVPGSKKRVMIIGAGAAGNAILSELHSNYNLAAYSVVALIDDSVKKKGSYLGGVKVVGGRDMIIETARDMNVDEIYFAIPSADAQTVKDILDICKKTDCKLKKLPGIYQLINEQVSVTKLKDVDYLDLLGREPITPDLTEAFSKLRGKTVLVTGGGGSIGSELCRQIAASGAVKRLVIFDIAENGAYEIQQELRRTCPELDLKVLIGSVRDKTRLEEVFSEYRPQYIYHAAAHKHVPLMEDSPKEAVKNNVFGTFNLAQTADKYAAERFVMISTDKAVNPTNIMGATKRICEMIVQSFNKNSKTDFVAVRFGNVLGSNGSVIPLFREQIEGGGPVTVTHPDIIRYFMLIPEAVSLVLKAGAAAKGGEIFILDMGTPVKIAELAENMIRLSGYKPGVDINIVYTGLREGEKLYEELLIGEEGIQKTADDLIYIAKPTEIDSLALFEKLEDLDTNMDRFTRSDIIDKVGKIVTTYCAHNTEYNEHCGCENSENE